jgi:polyisoprenyl-phosphate glycosyltransferase
MPQPAKTISIVVPVYFNADSLPLLFEELKGVEAGLRERDVAVELIFVNDGSRDGSFDALLRIKQHRPTTKIINLTRNFGSVAAIKTGFRFVTGDAFAIVAADLQDPVDQIVPMVDKWLEGHKFVICARTSRQDPLLTRLFSRAYYTAVRRLVAAEYPSIGYDLMLMDKLMLPYMQGSAKHSNPQLYSFWLGFKPAVLEAPRRQRTHGRSGWRFTSKLNYLVDSISGFSAAPIRVLSIVGIVVALASFVYGISIFLAALLGGVEVKGFATLAVLISFFSGLILVMLGVLGEYLWRVLDAINNKPEAVIDETLL